MRESAFGIVHKSLKDIAESKGTSNPSNFVPVQQLSRAEREAHLDFYRKRKAARALGAQNSYDVYNRPVGHIYARSQEAHRRRRKVYGAMKRANEGKKASIPNIRGITPAQRIDLRNKMKSARDAGRLNRWKNKINAAQQKAQGQQSPKQKAQKPNSPPRQRFRPQQKPAMNKKPVRVPKWGYALAGGAALGAVGAGSYGIYRHNKANSKPVYSHGFTVWNG